MITLSLQRHIQAQIKLSNEFMGAEINIEVCGSTIFFRYRNLQTQVDTMMAKAAPQRITNAIAALDGSIYDYELDNATHFIMELI